MFIVIFENNLKRVWKQFGSKRKGLYWMPGEYQYCQQGKRILCTKNEETGEFFNFKSGAKVTLTKDAKVEQVCQ